MGIFDFFSRKKKANLTDKPATLHQPSEDKWNERSEKRSQIDAEQMLEKVEVIPGLILPRAFANHWPELSQTKTSFIKINATPSVQLTLKQSKFGGFPMLPAGMDYPKDQLGGFMFPLAQINFRELPPLPGYPVTGYLQFYIASDDTHGLRFDNNPSDFKVLFFEEQELQDHQTDFEFLQPVLESDIQPVFKPHALSFELKDEYFGIDNVENAMNAGIGLQEIASKLQDEELEEELMEYMYDHHSHNGHKLGGYAYFTQTDPREYEEDGLKEYVLLLQIDTDDEIMWGDSGVANFFIHPDDLAKKDFSKIVYNWDCC